MSDITIANNIIKQFNDLESKRNIWLEIWDKCSEYTLPRAKHYKSIFRTIFDVTAPNALSTFTSVLESSITPRNMKWHSLSTGNTDLDQRTDVAQWLEYVTDILFAYRYDPESNFGNQMVEAYFGLGCFGTAAIFIDTFPDGRPRYQNIPIYEIFIDENEYSKVDTVFRCFKLTSRQAVQQFGIDKVSDVIKQDYNNNNYLDKKYEFIHSIFPNKNYDPTKLTDFPFDSFYIEKETKNLLIKGGYKTLPYAVSRFYSGFREVYGRSPAHQVLPDILMANELRHILLRAGHNSVSPTLLTSNEDIVQAYTYQPDTIARGTLDSEGRPMVMPLQYDNRGYTIGKDLLEDCRNNIEKAFFITLFNILVSNPNQQTATEVLQRAQEQAQLIAPVIGKQQEELIMPIIKREVQILLDLGVIPEAPNGITEIVPKYTTKVIDNLNSQKGLNILQALQAVTPILQSDPNIAMLIDMKKVVKEVFEGFGATMTVFRTDEELAQLQQQQAEAQANQQQQQQLQEVMGNAGGLANAMKTLNEIGVQSGQ